MKFREFVYMYEEKIIIKSDHLGVNRLEQIYSIIGDMNMMDIIPMYIMEVVSLIQNSMAPGTADKYFRFLKRAFDFAQKEGCISENPMKHIELPQYKREVRNTKILESQRKCLMVLIEASKQKTFLQMMSIIGLPFNVARALFWDDIDFVGDILNVRYAVKDRVTDINARYLMDSDKQRKIHIPPFIMKGLMEIYEKQTASIRNKNEVTSLHRPIFQSSDGRLYSANKIYRELKQIGNTVGIDNLCFGDLCRDSIYQAVLMDVPLVDIMGYYNIGNNTDMIMRMYKEIRGQKKILESGEKNGKSVWYD